LRESVNTYRLKYEGALSSIKDLNESYKSTKSETSSTIKSLNEDLQRSSTDLDSITEQLHFSEDKYTTLIKEYFSLRCTQLGLNESLISKSITGDISTYTYKELEDILHEAVSRRPKSQNSLFESVDSKLKVKASITSTLPLIMNNSDFKDPELENLTESCRGVRNQ
jgi:3-hydroxyacyl-CoA dehydrogenase